MKMFIKITLTRSATTILHQFEIHNMQRWLEVETLCQKKKHLPNTQQQLNNSNNSFFMWSFSLCFRYRAQPIDKMSWIICICVPSHCNRQIGLILMMCASVAYHCKTICRPAAESECECATGTLLMSFELMTGQYTVVFNGQPDKQPNTAICGPTDKITNTSYWLIEFCGREM